jgi:hypothetical protein
VKRKRIRKSHIDPTPPQPRISRKLEATALLEIDRMMQRESDESIDGHFEFPYQKVLSISTFQPAPPEPIHVSLDDESTGQPLFEGGESDPPPDDLTVLANNLEPELAGHSAPRVYCGSFPYERPLECQVLMRGADESDEHFQCRIEVEKKDVQTEMLKRVNLMLKWNDEKRNWNTDEVLIFLNNLENSWRCQRGFRTDEDGSGAYVCTFVAEKREGQELDVVDPVIHIRYPIESLKSQPSETKRRVSSARRRRDDFPLTNGIEVSVSLAWVTTAQVRAPGEAGEESVRSRLRPVWSPIENSAELTHYDERRRYWAREREVLMGHFEGRFKSRESSSWIEKNELLLVHEKGHFSRPMRSFVRNFPREHIHEAEYTLSRLQDALHVTRTKERVDHSAEAFLNLPGWLCLRLSENEMRRKREEWIHKGEKHWIVSGFWIHPKAVSILRGNEIDGIIMDTTFTVMRQYRAAILMAVSHNVGIPLALSFGYKEDFALYNSFYMAFDSLGIDIRTYILESDQGPALKRVGQRHPRHLFCLRHVLKTLNEKKCGRFGSLVGNLLRVRTQKELDLLMIFYTRQFAAVHARGNINGELIQLTKCLAKVGLEFQDGQLIYNDGDGTRWNQVAMVGRIGTCMPATSNTIECLNGYLNGVTPRHNTFWGSLHRIAEMFTMRIERFECCWRHNMTYEAHKAANRYRNVQSDQMRKEMIFFETDATECLCGETIFGSQMYRCDIPCSHRIAHWRCDPRHPRDRDGGDTPPEDRPGSLPTIALVAVDQWLSCQLTVEEYRPSALDPGREQYALDVHRLVKRIARDAHVSVSAKGEEIKAFVEANLHDTDEFVLGESISFWAVHCIGVERFTPRVDSHH